MAHLLLVTGALLVPLVQVPAPSPLDKLDPSAITPLERFDWQPKELVAVLGEHRGRQGSAALSVAYSPDGKLVASGGGNGLVRIWDRGTMRQRHALGTSSGVARVCFFHDGKMLACCTAAASVQLWDMTGDKPKPTLTLQKGSTPYYALAVSPSGRYVAAGGADATVRVWDLHKEGDKLLTELFGHTGAVTALAFSPRGKTLVSSGNDGAVQIYSIAGEKIQKRDVLKAHEKEVTSVAFSEGGTLASGGSDGTVRLWDLNASPPRQKQIIPTQAGSVSALAFGPRGSTLATGQSDSTIRVWTMGNPPRQKCLLEGHLGPIHDVAFAPTKSGVTEVASAGADWTVRLWPTTGPKPRDKFVRTGHLSHTYAVDFSADGKRLVSGSYDTSVRLWEFGGKAAKEQLVWKKDPMQVYTVAFSPDGATVAYGGNDTAVRLWSPQRRWLARKLTGNPGQVSTVAFSPDGKQLVTCSQNSIRLYDTSTGRAEREFTGHTKTVNSVAFSPDGKYVLSGGGNYEYKDNLITMVNGKVVYFDCTTRLWDAESGKELFSIKDHEFPVLSVSYAPDGRHIAYGLQEPSMREVELLDDKPGKATRIKGKTYGLCYWVRYAPDGKTFVTVGLDGKVILWDASTKDRLREWSLNEVTYRAVYSPDSRHLAVPLGTGVVYILRLPTK